MYLELRGRIERRGRRTSTCPYNSVDQQRQLVTNTVTPKKDRTIQFVMFLKLHLFMCVYMEVRGHLTRASSLLSLYLS